MNVLSMTLVRPSASMIAVETHLQVVWSLDCSLSNMTSIVVLHSWQLGTAFFVIRSKRDLQSVIIKPAGSCLREISGLDHMKLGSFMKPHMHRIHVSLSNELDMA